MTRQRLGYRFAALTVAGALAFGAVGSSAGGQAPDERDAVIARQVALIDEQATLIVAQESLLNDYRCLFDIDTQLVPNGCPDQAQPTPVPTATATPTVTATPTPDESTTVPELPSGTTEEQWEQLRQCNANGNYQYANPNGVNFGAYEFRQSSWDDLARRHYPHLVGVHPRDAAPADQDRMAYALYEERGRAPWPVCGASLTSTSETPTTQPTETAPEIPAGTTAAQWEQLRQCESTGYYGAYNSSGPYYGAYQFNQPTWDGVAGRHYPHLVGVDPRDAAPADQDRMAYALYRERGWQPWPHCGAPFRQ